MWKIETVCPDTNIHSVKGEWIPSSFENFLLELANIQSLCQQQNHLLLFRGHRNRTWLLDSTFVRSFKKTLFGIRSKRLSQRIVTSASFHSAMLNLFFLKFGVLGHPSEELNLAKEKYGIDPWFEWMKRIQQHPEDGADSCFLPGTNLLDWTQSSDVALYFANQRRRSEGVLYICDATATGKTLQTLPVSEIMDRMSESENSVCTLSGPLLFSPPKQIKNIRAKNQQAAYFAQMDLRHDLEHIWRLQEAQNPDETILIKLVLPADSEAEAQRYMEKREITDAFIFPDENEPT